MKKVLIYLVLAVCAGILGFLAGRGVKRSEEKPAPAPVPSPSAVWGSVGAGVASAVEKAAETQRRS